MKILPPGFRFHPTNVELLKYYLKRKILNRPLHFDAIREVDIYELDPWELPSLSCLKTDDQKWYFFCPRERRYAHGGRVKRSTRGGFWKTTGRDRPVKYNDETIGMIKTLIFHEGRAPNGSRTDWVMHEYRLEDPDLAAKGIQQDTVLCAIFKKKGLGPRNGAQYGAPFKEEDWEDDEVSVVLPQDLLISARGLVQAHLPSQEEQQDHSARRNLETDNNMSESIAVVGSPPPVLPASETVLPEPSGAALSVQAHQPSQEEQQDHSARRNLETDNNMSESIAVVGSPPPVLPASETVLPEPSGVALSSDTALINHANETVVEAAVNDTSADGMDIDEFLAIINTSPVDNNNQEIQTAAAVGPDVGATIAAAAAEGNGGIFAGLPDLDVQLEGIGGFTRGSGFGYPYYFQSDDFMELHDLGPHLSRDPTPLGNLPGAEIDMGNADITNAETNGTGQIDSRGHELRENFNHL
ncbi:hypothetical protein CDL15_Pgr017370 [Punica granatum]|nr:hypothetical protein CDL15_Pgr017370 [Punica granatum]